MPMGSKGPDLLILTHALSQLVEDDDAGADSRGH
jgi:hypothetical protein